MKKVPFINGCKYDYAHKCDCAEDDKCGCVYPNNMDRNFTSICFDKLEDDITEEKLNIKCSKREEEEFLPVKERAKSQLNI